MKLLRYVWSEIVMTVAALIVLILTPTVLALQCALTLVDGMLETVHESMREFVEREIGV